jgi:hypothetical protein
MIKFLKLVKESRNKKTRDMAYRSAQIYYSGRAKTAGEFQAYQRGFINAYSTAYIKAARKHNKV